MFKNHFVVMCDFDGTVTVNDVTDSIMRAFASSKWNIVGKKYIQGKITHAQMNRQFVDLLDISVHKLQDFIKKTTKLRNGFSEFTKYCQNKRLKLIIISGGWNFYISKSLDINNLVFADTFSELEQSLEIIPGISVVCNSISKVSSSKKWRISYPWEKYSCQISSPCKGKFVDFFHSKNKKVIVIGDGHSDICMARKADYAFATGKLPDLLKKEAIPFTHFDNFREVRLYIDRIIV